MARHRAPRTSILGRLAGRSTPSPTPAPATSAELAAQAPNPTADPPTHPLDRVEPTDRAALVVHTAPAATGHDGAASTASPPLRLVTGRRITRTVETAESVRLCYPDGRQVPVGWNLAEVLDGGRHRRYLAEVPEGATLTDGVVIRAGAVLASVRLDPTTEDWIVGGAAR
jgi:hypothetical protein